MQCLVFLRGVIFGSQVHVDSFVAVIRFVKCKDDCCIIRSHEGMIHFEPDGAMLTIFQDRSHGHQRHLHSVVIAP
jgi:hypothetical protein